MKNKVICLMFMLCLVTTLVACGKAKESTEQSSVKTEVETEIVDNQKNKNSETVNKVTQTEDETTETTDVEEATFEVLNFGDTITTDFLEMTIDSASQAQELLPTDTSGAYSYKADIDGETFFYLTGNMKNIGGNSYSVEEMNAEFCFDDKYTYSAYIAADDGGNDFFGDTVKPFDNVKYYLYSSIPDELINSYTTCLIRFGFHDNFEHDYKKDFSVYEHTYEITVTK